MQTSPFFMQQFWDTVTGLPAADGSLAIYEAGSATLANIYADRAGLVLHANPMSLNGIGIAPQYFVQVGQALDYKAFNVNGASIFTALDVMVETGAGGTDDHKVAVSGSDNAPDYLGSKLITSPSVIVEPVPGSMTQKLRSVVDESWLLQWLIKQGFLTELDHKVKGDASDPTPGFLDAKIEDGVYIDFSVDPTTHRIRADFVGPDYVPQHGGDYTGPVIFHDTVVLANVPGTGNLLTIDAGGGLGRISFPPDDHLVLASATDTVPGALRVKLQPGSGMRMDSTIDPDLGEIVSISMINIPEPIVIPAKRIVLGSGTGVTSYVDLTYYNKQLVADAVSVETFYLGAGSYAGFSNKEVRAVPSRNFKDGVTQYADGTVRVGANGDYGAIKITDSTKIIDTANDTTLRVGGKMLDPGVEIADATYTLPVVAAGETRTIRFNGAAGCTITADAAQVPRYRSSSTGQSVVGTAGGQVDAASIFGTAAGCKVASITIKGISATACQVIY